MKVPLLDLAAQHDPIRKELERAIASVIDTQQFILGPAVTSFEAQLAACCGTRFAVGVSSGTDALLAVLMALGIGPGDEVITTAYSFFATAGVIARLGARPVFVDIDQVSFNINPALIEGAINRRTRAIVPVALFGQCAEMEAIVTIAHRCKLKVIEDAAQAIGAAYHGKRAGALGDAGCFSFFPSKNLGALGDGGAVVTDDSALADALRIVRAHGANPKYHHRTVGGNFRLDSIQAAVLAVKLKYLDGWTEQRRLNAGRYNRMFAASGLISRGLVRTPAAVHERSSGRRSHIYNQYVILAERRDHLKQHLTEKGIGTEIYYPIPFHLQECFRSLSYKRGDFPESERAADHALALPIYAELSEAQQQYVVDSIVRFYQI